MTLTVFKAGNTWAVSIPRELARKLNIEPGDKVEPYLVDHSFAYRPVGVDPSLKKWFGNFKKRYGPALRELAKK